MAVYKSTYCSPSSTPFDLTDITDTNPFKLYFKVDTSNTKIIGYSVELYDVNQNKIFPVDRDNLITSVSSASPAWVNGENVSIDFIVRTNPTTGDILNNTLWFNGTYVSYYEFNPAGPGSWKTLDSVANGNEYSWKVILYQTDVTKKAPAILPDSDMVLTTGTMMGSTKERIQSVPTEEVVTDYFLQPVSFDTLNYEPGQEKTWTYGGDVKQIGNRVRIKDYDPTYGYYYLQTGQYGLDCSVKQSQFYTSKTTSIAGALIIENENRWLGFLGGSGFEAGKKKEVWSTSVGANNTARLLVIPGNVNNGEISGSDIDIILKTDSDMSQGDEFNNYVQSNQQGWVIGQIDIPYDGYECVPLLNTQSGYIVGERHGLTNDWGNQFIGMWVSYRLQNGGQFFTGQYIPQSYYGQDTSGYQEAVSLSQGKYNVFLNINYPPNELAGKLEMALQYQANLSFMPIKFAGDNPDSSITSWQNNPLLPNYLNFISNGSRPIFGIDASSGSSITFYINPRSYKWGSSYSVMATVDRTLQNYQIYKLSNDTSLLSTGDQVDYVIDKEVNMTWVSNASSETRSHWLQQYTVTFGRPTNQPFASLGAGYNFPVGQGARVVFNGQVQNEYNGIFVMGGDGYNIQNNDRKQKSTEAGDTVDILPMTIRSLVTITYGTTLGFVPTSGTIEASYTLGQNRFRYGSPLTNIKESATGNDTYTADADSLDPNSTDFEDIKVTLFSDTQTVTIEWYRAPDADTWGEIYNKVVHVSNPDSPVFYGQNIQLEQVLSEMSGGAINSTPINYILEEPIEIYPDMDTAGNDLRRTTGLVFNNILDVSSTTKTMYIRPFNGIQKNMIWRQTDVNYPLNKYYKIADVNTDYWYVQYTDLYDQQSDTELSTTPNFVIDKTKYEIRSSFLDGDVVPFNFYAKPTIGWITYIDEAGIIVGGKFSYLQQPFLSWKQFQGFVKNGMIAPTEEDPGVPIRQLSTNVFYSGNTWIQSPNYDLIYRIYQKMIKYKVSQTTINNKKLHVRTTSRITLEMAEQTTMTLNVKYASGQSGVLTMNFKDGFSARYFYNVILDQDMMGYSCDFEFGGAAVNTIESVSSFGVDDFTLTQGSGSAALSSSKHYVAYSLRFYGNDGGIYDSNFHALPYNSPQNKLENNISFEFDCGQCAVRIHLPKKNNGDFYSYIFKREIGKDNPFELINRVEGGATIPENTFYDYSVANGRTYEYIAIIANSYSANYYKYSGLITPRFDYWALNDFEINDDGALSVGETWKLRYNADPGAVTQNITKTKFDNLSQYPTYSYGLTNYASGSMSCLLGREVMIATSTGTCMGNWYVERLSDNSIFRNLTSNEAISMEKLWRALVHSGHKKLLRDIKGNMWVVQIVASNVQNQDGYNGSPAMLNFDWEECDLSQEDMLKMLSDTSSTASAVTTFGYVTNTTGTTQIPYLIMAASNSAITYSDASLSQRSSPETVLNDTSVEEEKPYVPPSTIV